jgi:hypothetical protein
MPRKENWNAQRELDKQNYLYYREPNVIESFLLGSNSSDTLQQDTIN